MFIFQVSILFLILYGNCLVVGQTRRGGTCRVGELRCQNGDLCVPREQVCDGERNCEDGLDEYVCNRRTFFRNVPKNVAVFQCQFGGVIPLKMLCDGKMNCLDGSDESEICENNSCLPGKFRCKYGGCIADYLQCNGRRDCPDGSDETADVCQNFQCEKGQFMCKYGACIKSTKICNLYKDCADGSDENEYLCLITRAKMLAEWRDKEERSEASEKRKNSNKSPNSIVPPKSFSRFAPIITPTSTSTSSSITTTPTPITSRSTETTSISENENLQVESNDKGNDNKNSNSDATGKNSDAPPNLSNDNKDYSTVPTPITQTPIVENPVSSGTNFTSSPLESPPVTCMLPEIPENTDATVLNCMNNGKVCNEEMKYVPIATQIHYECDAGYSLYGAPIIVCQDDGKWSLKPPVCEVILDVRFGLGSIIPRDFKPRCPPIKTPKGSLVECIDPTNLEVKSCSELQKPGTEARLTCKSYYRPASDLPVQYEKCGEDGRWSPGAFQQFSCVADCGLSEVPRTPFIVNGKSIKRGQWPWHVGIYVEKEGNFTYICGGALITENAILTSAHCVTRHGAVLDPGKFKIFLGKQNIMLPDNDPFVQSRHVSKVIVEDAFNYRSLDSDIAILALETPAVLSYFVRPVCYPQNSNSFLEEYQLTQGNLGTVVGWGATENQSLSRELRMTELPVVSHQDCVEAYRDFFASMTRSTNYCAGYLNGTSLCNGDSGGGQYFKAVVKGASRWYIQGLVSYGVPKAGSKQCSSSHYTVFTRVGRYADWIVRTLSRENLK